VILGPTTFRVSVSSPAKQNKTPSFSFTEDFEDQIFCFPDSLAKSILFLKAEEEKKSQSICQALCSHEAYSLERWRWWRWGDFKP
jgi:hypothetical protein